MYIDRPTHFIMKIVVS